MADHGIYMPQTILHNKLTPVPAIQFQKGETMKLRINFQTFP